MRVLLLGAGASKPVGYPLAAELLAEIEKAATASPNFSTRAAWADFQEWRGEAKGILKRLLDNPNPEVVLSVSDLIQEGRVQKMPTIGVGRLPRVSRPASTKRN